MVAITNVTIVMPDSYIYDGTILLENKKIVDFGKNIVIPEGSEIIDGEGLFAGPGLIDIHTHGDGNQYFYDNPAATSKYLLSHGVTSVLTALYYNLSKDEFIDAIDVIDKASQNGEFPNFAGYYMEGPYLNPDYGCQREFNKWTGKIKREDYMEILEKVKNTARVWCVAPEREGILDFVKDTAEAIPGIVFSIAHSEATPKDIEALIPHGLSLATHHLNAVGTPGHSSGCHGVGPNQVVQYTDSIYAELICDFLGIHVNPYMLKLTRKIKGDDKIILISDAFVATGSAPEKFKDAFDINFDNNGGIAGSKLTLDIACSNMMMHTGASICDVFKFASLNPAKLLNFTTKGQIKIGNDADIILVDNHFQVKKTILKGEVYYASKI